MINRRNFLKSSVMGGIAVAYGGQVSGLTSYETGVTTPPKVALTTGDNRADLVFRALQPFSKEIKQAIGNKLVVLKPNLLTLTIPLSVTHVDTLEGVLEFLKSINKLKNVVIADSSAAGSAFVGYSNFGYNSLLSKYPVKLLDLDLEKHEILYVLDEKDFRPHPVRVSSMILSPDTYVVSVARMKTHDLVVATLSLKNIVLGAPIKSIDKEKSTKERTRFINDKRIIHGGGSYGINYNMYALAHKLHPDLAIIDGFEGMEGRGPSRGTPVDHRICLASPDWFAADRVGIELMGIDLSTVGYLTYCAQTGMGEPDLNKIEIIGERIADHKKKYQLGPNIEFQLKWMKPPNFS